MKSVGIYTTGMLVFFVGISSAAAAELNGKPRIIDGDTIEIAGQRVRLHGIDSPESKQKCRKSSGSEYHCGTMATFALAELIEEHWVKCVGEGTDRYGRLIGTCFTGPVNLNKELVRRGWAVAYRRYSSYYIAVENEAKSAQRGLWQGAFIKPWDWRRGVRVQGSAPSSSGKMAGDPSDLNCKIKGNISRSGTRIYHLPGSRHYAKTKINTAAGERWFCRQDEAVKAGWRAAK
jgi:endonuclease YncB( thermonuclease family)